MGVKGGISGRSLVFATFTSLCLSRRGLHEDDLKRFVVFLEQDGVRCCLDTAPHSTKRPVGLLAQVRRLSVPSLSEPPSSTSLTAASGPTSTAVEEAAEEMRNGRRQGRQPINSRAAAKEGDGSEDDFCSSVVEAPSLPDHVWSPFFAVVTGQWVISRMGRYQFAHRSLAAAAEKR